MKNNRKTFYDIKHNSHGCTLSVTVDKNGMVVDSTGCCWSGHGGYQDGWANGMCVEITGDNPEDGDWLLYQPAGQEPEGD